MRKAFVSLIVLALTLPLFAYSYSDLHAGMMSNCPDIRKAREQVNQALLDVKDAKAGYAPTIDLTVTGTYIGNPIDPIRVNIGDYVDTARYGITNDYITVYGGQENMLYQFQLQLTQPVFTWGKLNTAVKLYQDVYEARVMQLEDAIEKAETELATRMAAVHYMLQVQALLESQTTIANRLVDLAADAQKNGVMLATEALSVKVRARQIDVAKAQLDQQIQLMVTSIGNLTGVPDLKATDVGFDESGFGAIVSGIVDADYATMLAKCLSDGRTTFALLSKLSSIASYRNSIAGASVNWKPDFAIVVNATYGGSRLPFVETDWYGKDDWNALLTIAMKTTVFDGGKAVRNVTRTRSEVSESVIDIQSAKDKVRYAVDENYTNALVCIAQIDYQNAQIEQKAEKSKVDRQLQDSGYGSESDYLQGQLDYNNCLIEVLQQRISLAQAVYTLTYLQGDSSELT